MVRVRRGVGGDHVLFVQYELEDGVVSEGFFDFDLGQAIPGLV